MFWCHTATNIQQGTKRSRGTDAAAEVATEKDVNIGIDINTVIADEGDENIGVDLNSLPSVDTKKRQKRQKLKHRTKKDPADATSHGVNTEPLQMDGNLDFLNSKTVRPRGTPVTKIAGAELDDEDTGAAIQFIEFCRAFTEVVKGKKEWPYFYKYNGACLVLLTPWYNLFIQMKGSELKEC